MLLMEQLWQYEGDLDASGKKLTLVAEGPNHMAAGKLMKFRDVCEFKSPDHIITTSSMQTDGGKWGVFMSGDMRRKK